MNRLIFCILLSAFSLHPVSAFSLRERIYVQTDKHLYLSGEPVFMKFLTTDSELIPLAFSKIAYAELVANDASRLQIKVALDNGIGAGQMLLPADLPTGYYRLIAYTQWMRNEGSDVFFEKEIAVINTFLSGYQPAESGVSAVASPSGIDRGASVSISAQTDKQVYSTREHGKITFSGLPDNIHTLSATIAGVDLVPASESNRMLFEKKMPNSSLPLGNFFLPEYEGHIVAGKIIDNQTGEIFTGNIAPANAGLSFPGDELRFFAGQMGNNEDVLFFTSEITGTKEIATVVYNADERFRIDVQSPFVSQFAPKEMPSLHIDSMYYQQLLERSVALQLFRYFSDDPSENNIVTPTYLRLEPSRNYPLDEYTRFTTMREVFIEFIAGARFRRRDGNWEMSVLTRTGTFFDYGATPLVLLDGVAISDHNAVYSYDPLSVETINVYYGPYHLGGYRFDGIIELITYRQNRPNLNLNRSMQVITYEGPQKIRSLQTPDYSDADNRSSRTPDSRHTLLWEPKIDNNGSSSIQLPFNTSDLAGEFQVTLEGVTKNGELIYVTTLFTVER